MVEHFVSKECLADRVVSMDPSAMIRMVREYARKVDLALNRFETTMTAVIEKREALQKS